MLQSVDVAAAAELTVFPASVSKTISSTDGLSHSATTPLTSAAITGGTAPYTWAWSLLSGDPSITINSPSSNSTSFTATLSPGESKTGAFKLTVTDANGVTKTVEVSAYFNHVDLR
jgi:hypothetical protein